MGLEKDLERDCGNEKEEGGSNCCDVRDWGRGM